MKRLRDEDWGMDPTFALWTLAIIVFAAIGSIVELLS